MGRKRIRNKMTRKRRRREGEEKEWEEERCKKWKWKIIKLFVFFGISLLIFCRNYIGSNYWLDKLLILGNNCLLNQFVFSGILLTTCTVHTNCLTSKITKSVAVVFVMLLLHLIYEYRRFSVLPLL